VPVKKFVVILSLILLLLGAGFFGLWYYAHEKAEDWVRDALNHRLLPEVEVSFGQLKFDLLKRNLELYHLQVHRTQGDSLEWSAFVQRIRLQGFNLEFLWKDVAVALEEIDIDSAKLVLHSARPNFRLFTSDTLAESPDTQRRSLSIGRVYMLGGQLDFDPPGPERLQCNFEAGLLNFIHNPALGKPNWDSSALHFWDVLYQPADSVYRLQLADLRVEKAEPAVVLRHLEWLPNLGEKAFARRFPHRKTRMHLRLDSASFQGIDIMQMDTLRLKRLDAYGLWVALWRDNRLPKPSKPKPMPQEMLTALKLPLHIEAISLRTGRMDFSLKSRDEADAGKLFFTALRADILGLQNIDKQLPAFRLMAQGRLQGQSALQLNARYSYGPKHPWKIAASVGSFELAQLNPIMSSAVGMKISQGQMQELKYEMRGDAQGGRGFVDFYYHNLHLEMLQRNTRRERWIGRLADQFGGWVYRRHNPERTVYKRGEFAIERDVFKDFTGLWIDGLLEGMLETLSKIDTHKARELKRRQQDRQKERKRRRN
jgi:hypothetical protein